MKSKSVYMFSEGRLEMRNLLGGKGATLADMTHLALPIPQGFIVTTETCNAYYQHGNQLPQEVIESIEEGLAKLEIISGKRFGDVSNPLLVSVRSGARVSMPGMMDTILNLGLNDQTVLGLAQQSNNTRFAFDSYRRFIQMFSDVVMGIDRHLFEDILDRMKHKAHVDLDSDLEEAELKVVVDQFKMVYETQTLKEFPQDPKEQLLLSIAAVFKSWMNPRAHVYRKMHGYSNEWGTAVNVQEMVFGNLGNTSGSGVAFSRSPVDGSPGLFGEYLLNVQGEDVVAGIRTPHDLSGLKDEMPAIYDEFEAISKRLEHHYKDMQDMEFTIENGKLFVLQSRSGKRTAAAALKIAVDMVSEGLLTKEEALLQLDANQLHQLLHPQFIESALAQARRIGSALAASPGAGSGRLALSAGSAMRMAHQNEDVILVRAETSPEDIEGMQVARGILTARGGMTSHAAVVARGMGIPCVSGCGEILFGDGYIELDGTKFYEGDGISIDGSTGLIYEGLIKTQEPKLSDDFKTVMRWIETMDSMVVLANADSVEDTLKALSYGAQGIGLTRTEHMFFHAERILVMRQMILSDDEMSRRHALDHLLPMQRDDFIEILDVLEGRPVTVRLLDPPLHEFLPSSEQDIEALAKVSGMSVRDLKTRMKTLHEYNPMMGHRGVRLAISYPEIAKMQTRAMIEAAIVVQKRSGIPVQLEIMVPLVGDVREFEFIKDVIQKEAQDTLKAANLEVHYTIGSMMETPRACLMADTIALDSEFFSFGTNDLTQFTYGLSRDDATVFLEEYYDSGIYSRDPFESLDEEGVGSLIAMAVEKARKVKPDIYLGVCGEHGGDARSIQFFDRIGMDFVSCSPFRVPVARLAAVQARLAKDASKV